jgi:hypothetical protein
MNPSQYKDDFNQSAPIQPKGMIPTTTNAMVLQSQREYKSKMRLHQRFILPSKSQTRFKKPKEDLDDTFVKFENEQMEKQKGNIGCFIPKICNFGV